MRLLLTKIFVNVRHGFCCENIAIIPKLKLIDNGSELDWPGSARQRGTSQQNYANWTFIESEM